MTEAEWLACEDPKALWMHCDQRATERKKTLLRAVVCRHALTTTNQTEQYEFELSVLEGLADEQVDEAVKARIYNRLRSNLEPTARFYRAFNDLPSPAMYMEFAIIVAFAPGGVSTGNTLEFAQDAIKAALIGEMAVRQIFTAFIREIFGNPFRPITFASVWRTADVLAIAQGMYESRDFGAMPILADALQDAGCDNADILRHCRGEEAHVRGCWVIDLILGKE